MIETAEHNTQDISSIATGSSSFRHAKTKEASPDTTDAVCYCIT